MDNFCDFHAIFATVSYQFYVILPRSVICFISLNLQLISRLSFLENDKNNYSFQRHTHFPSWPLFIREKGGDRSLVHLTLIHLYDGGRIKRTSLRMRQSGI